MRLNLKVACALIVVGIPQSVAAQMLDDGPVCTRLRESKKFGLYVVYPGAGNSGATCVDGYCYKSVNGGAAYNPQARFFFLEPNNRRREGVWHIRTQTQALGLVGADLARVSSPSRETRCDRAGARGFRGFFGFGGATLGQYRMVPLNIYADHHSGPGEQNRPDYGLSENFHIPIQSSPDAHPESADCIKTDDRAFNLKERYGFEGVRRTEQQVARLFLFTATAEASVAPRDAALSSEFAYQDSAEPACFGFAVPIPTVSSRPDALNWKPQRTSITIKQLSGRKVSVIMDRKVVKWTNSDP